MHIRTTYVSPHFIFSLHTYKTIYVKKKKNENLSIKNKALLKTNKQTIKPL